jgi:2-oxoglutarate dehydrogenase E1 component
MIDKVAPVFDKYSQQLLRDGVVSEQDLKMQSEKILRENEKGFLESKNYAPDPLEWLASNWQGKAIGSLVADRPYNQTGVAMHTLHQVGRSLLYVPEDMVLHPEIKSLLSSRKKMLETEEGLTMAFAEALAFGCLMKKFEVMEEPDTPHGPNISHPTVHIRLSGQDCVRGTFNQRHAKIVCQKTSKSFWQLNNLDVKEQASISVCNSALSEAAVLGTPNLQPHPNP